MSDVIKFANYETLVSILATINQQVSGMSASEAEAALSALKNSGLYIANTSNNVLGSNVVNFPNTTATQAISEYISGGGSTATSGAAIGITGDATLTANIAIGQTRVGQAATAVYGVLSTPLPIAAAAIAPFAGASLGVGLYELNPELWTKISQTLVPWAWTLAEEKFGSMPALIDEEGNTYYSEEAIEALKTLLNSIAISTGERFTTSSTVTFTPHTANEYISYGGMYATLINKALELKPDMIPDISQPFFISCEVEPTAISFTFQKSTNISTATVTNTFLDGVRCQLSKNISIGTRIGNGGIKLYNDGTWNIFTGGGFSSSNYAFAYSYVFNLTGGYLKGILVCQGDITQSYPEGITQWNGEAYPSTITPINVLTGYDTDGNPIYTVYYPLTTPALNNGASIDPAVNPNPAVNLDPATIVNLLINPVSNPALYPESVPVSEPAPIPNPVPITQPVPLPDIDPSSETTQPEKNPDSPTDPTDSGTTPTPSIPVIPTLPSSATGLLHVYNPTQTQIDDFGSWLWTTFSGDLIDTLSKLFNDPMDAVIGLHELYATPAVSGSTTIRCGYLDSGIVSNFVGSRYTTINCGSVVVEEYYQNYLDYSPYTHCFIYLPFIGIVPVSSDDIIGNAVNITYHVDSYTGCCIAVVTVAKSGYSSVAYQFEGNCAVEIPVSSGYQSSLMSGLLAVAGTAITSNPSIGLSASHIGRAGLGKNTVQHSGSFGSSYGAMGSKIPYIIVKRPVQKKVYNYSESYGFPAHKMVYVGNCEGYLRAQEVRVTSTTATNIEKDMIVNALKNGVYVK